MVFKGHQKMGHKGVWQWILYGEVDDKHNIGVPDTTCVG